MAAEVAPAITPYEEQRQKKLEENKKKLDELRLSHLSTALSSSLRSPTSTKSSPASGKRKVRSQETEAIVLRRSDRVAKLQDTNYKEFAAYDVIERPKRYRSSESYGKRRDLSGRVYASYEARMYATNKAEEIASQLEDDLPCFVKPMTQSHVTGGFWLGLPRHFCIKYLSRKDLMMTLVDESGDEYDTLYLHHKNGLSGGWRGFSIAHELVDGDAAVFQLISPTTFRVYIVRAREYYTDRS